MITTFNPRTNMSYANSPNFKGQATHEILKIDNKKKLIRHETAFFRDYKTMKKSVGYLKKTFPKEEKLQIIVGACSSGEQALSFEMLLKNRKPHILGFDISPKSIRQAKSLTYHIKLPHGKHICEEIKNKELEAYDDVFLAFDSSIQPLTKTRKKLKHLFNQNFVEVQSVPKKANYIKKLIGKFKSVTKNLLSPNFTAKTFTVRAPQNIDCEFIEGDIRKLDEFVSPGKAHMLTFTNALYHLVTEDIHYGLERKQLPQEKTIPIITNILKQINKALVKNGVLVFGEHEDLQQTDMKLVSKLLSENGFKEVAKERGTYCNIWAKYKDST